MKRTTILGLMLLTFSIVSAKQKFTIKGNLTGITEDKKVFLTYRDNGENKEDSTIAKKGVFSLTGTVTEPTRATIEVRSMKRDTGEMTYEKYMARDVKDFFLENSAITVKGDKTVKTAKISGGKTQADYIALQASMKAFEDRMEPMMKSLRQLAQQKDQKAVDSVRTMMTNARKEMTKAQDEFIRSHNSSYVSLDLLQERSFVIELDNFEAPFNSLSDEAKNTPFGKKLAGKLDLAKKTSVGKPALEFTQQTTEEKPFSLASLKGKYVLVDFWASWCGPCRAENPNVVKAYNEFKDKNFEIVGVSLDDKKQPWLDAIKKDGLPWVHVSDLKGWKNDVAVLYGINAVPQNLLLDPNGVIIAKNLRGEELSKKLGELIK